jgi:hypothetical protein
MKSEAVKREQKKESEQVNVISKQVTWTENDERVV